MDKGVNDLDKYRVGVDTGGTFTDIVIIHEKTGELYSTKVSSTPDDPSLALVQGIRKALNQMGVKPEAISSLFHGTTVTTNALLQQKFEGFDLYWKLQGKVFPIVMAIHIFG